MRQFCEKDATEIFALRSSKEVIKYIDRPLSNSLEDALEFIKLNSNLLQNNEGISGQFL